MRQRRRPRPAPSTAAASYRVGSIAASAAKKTIVPQHVLFETASLVTTTMNACGFVIMFHLCRPCCRMTCAKRPAPPSIWTKKSAIAACDFTGNGMMDLAVANAGSNNVRSSTATATDLRAAVNIAVGTDPSDIKAANLTGNRITDLVVANHGSYNAGVSVLINNGSGSFTTDDVHRGRDRTRSRLRTSPATGPGYRGGQRR